MKNILMVILLITLTSCKSSTEPEMVWCNQIYTVREAYGLVQIYNGPIWVKDSILYRTVEKIRQVQVQRTTGWIERYHCLNVDF